MDNIFNEQNMATYKLYLVEQERSKNTVDKYMRDVRFLAGFLEEAGLDKALLVRYKADLERRYAPASVNSMLASANSFLEFIGRPDLRMKPLKIQKSLFRSEEKELDRDEYSRLIQAAKENGNERLMLIIETICSTGIRISELSFITVEAVNSGKAEIKCKGKRRTILLPNALRELLKKYSEKKNIVTGAVFITKSGNPLDRSNVWRDMKKLCESAAVDRTKVFPHNLRHLFARTFYSLDKDLSRLADILGHSNINTTRIYTIESGLVHARLLEQMNLVIMTT